MQREGVVLDTLFSSLPFPFILNLSLSGFLCFRVIPPVLRYQMAKYEVSPISLSYSRCHVPGGLWLRVSPTGETRRKREREREGGSQRLPFSVLVMYRLPSQPLEKLGTHSLGGGFRDHEWNPSWRVDSGVPDPPYPYPRPFLAQQRNAVEKQ